MLTLPLVHGLNDDPVETWTEGQLSWPKALLPEDLLNARLLLWGPDSRVADHHDLTSRIGPYGHVENFLYDVA